MLNTPTFCLLPSLGLLQVSGAEAAAFLQNQLTNEVLKQPDDQAALNGYCQAKGRLLASFLVWKNAEAVYLSVAADLAAPITKRLSMFVLRAKAKVADVSTQFASFGLLVPAVKASAPDFPLPDTVYGVTQTPHTTVIRLPDSTSADQILTQRYLVVSTAEHADATEQQLKSFAALADENAWQLASIHAGVPHITAATSEKFVPQMINFELLGGVSFKKGCYPGQEVLARTQYLGKLKRRLFLASTGAQAALIKPGDDVFTAGKEEAVGTVVNAAFNSQGGMDLLVEITLEAAESAAHSELQSGGTALRLLAPNVVDRVD